MDETVVIELAAKGFEIAGIEVFGEYRFGKGVGGVQYQQAAAPFDNAAALFRLEHVVEAADEFVEAHACGRDSSGCCC